MQLVSRVGSKKTILHCVNVIVAIVGVKTALQMEKNKHDKRQHTKKTDPQQNRRQIQTSIAGAQIKTNSNAHEAAASKKKEI